MNDTMRRARALLAAAPLLIALLLLACDSPSSPPSYSIPYGRYAWEDRSAIGGVEVRHTSTISLETYQHGAIYDTIATLIGGLWRVDSTTTTMLDYEQTGDGYLRTVQVTSSGTRSDTTLRYWYFFRRGDSVYYYTGDRFTGANFSLQGQWTSDARDTAAAGRSYTLRFSKDSVAIQGHSSEAGSVAGTFPYHTDGPILSIIGSPVEFGPRYEVVPTLALYLTTRASRGYARIN